MTLHLDTHVVIKLYARDRAFFSARARAALDHSRLVYSPIVELEMQYLHQIGRIAAGPQQIIGYLADRVALQADDTPYLVVARAARELSWTRDPFDRMITAAALASGQPLLTRDSLIRRHYSGAFWDEVG